MVRTPVAIQANSTLDTNPKQFHDHDIQSHALKQSHSINHMPYNNHIISITCPIINSHGKCTQYESKMNAPSILNNITGYEETDATGQGRLHILPTAEAMLHQTHCSGFYSMRLGPTERENCTGYSYRIQLNGNKRRDLTTD